MRTRTAPKSEGARQLLKALKARGLSLRRAEEMMEVSAGYLSRAIGGGRGMGRAPAVRAEAQFGVPVASWDEEPEEDTLPAPDDAPPSRPLAEVHHG